MTTCLYRVCSSNNSTIRQDISDASACVTASVTRPYLGSSPWCQSFHSLRFISCCRGCYLTNPDIAIFREPPTSDYALLKSFINYNNGILPNQDPIDNPSPRESRVKVQYPMNERSPKFDAFEPRLRDMTFERLYPAPKE